MQVPLDVGIMPLDPATRPTIPASRPSDAVFNRTSVEREIRRLPLGKASGPDGNPAELVTAGGEVMVEIMALFLRIVHYHAVIPSEWRRAYIVPVFKKKGSDTEVANYRPIALTCTVRRLYERLLVPELGRVMQLLDDAQGGFRPCRSSLDQAMVLHEALDSNEHAATVLLDIKAAYDEVSRGILWDILDRAFGVDEFMITRLQDLFDHNSSQLVVAGVVSDPILHQRQR